MEARGRSVSGQLNEGAPQRSSRKAPKRVRMSARRPTVKRKEECNQIYSNSTFQCSDVLQPSSIVYSSHPIEETFPSSLELHTTKARPRQPTLTLSRLGHPIHSRCRGIPELLQEGGPGAICGRSVPVQSREDTLSPRDAPLAFTVPQQDISRQQLSEILTPFQPQDTKRQKPASPFTSPRLNSIDSKHVRLELRG